MVQRVKDMIMYMGDPDKQLLHGSDGPLGSMGPHIKFLHNLELPEAMIENISWRTVARVFRIDTAGSESPV